MAGPWEAFTPAAAPQPDPQAAPAAPAAAPGPWANFAAPAAQPAAPAAPAAPQPQGDGYLFHVDPNSALGTGVAALNSFTDAATLGFGKDTPAAIRYVAGKLIPGVAPVSWQDAKAKAEGNFKGFNDANPITHIAGEGLGMVAGGGLMGVGAKGLAAATEGVPLVGQAAGALNSALGAAPEGTSLPGMIGRGAALGAGTATIADQFNNGPHLDSSSLINAGLGAAVGGGAVPVAAFAASFLPNTAVGRMVGSLLSKPAAQKPIDSFLAQPGNTEALQAILPHLNMTPEQVTQTAAQLHSQLGKTPTLAQVIGTRAQANIASHVAADSPALGASLREAAGANTQALPGDVAGAIAGARPISTVGPAPFAGEPPPVRAVPPAAQDTFAADPAAHAVPTAPTNAAPEAAGIATASQTQGDVLPTMPNVQNEKAIRDAAEAQMDAARIAASKAGTPWETQGLPITKEDAAWLATPQVRAAVKTIDRTSQPGTGPLTKRLDTTLEALSGPEAASQINSPLTVDNLDQIRRIIGGRSANPGQQGMVNVQDLGATRAAIGDMAARNSPSYGAALAHNRAIEQYGNGLKQGVQQDITGFRSMNPAESAGLQSGIVSGQAQAANASPNAALNVANNLTQAGTQQDVMRLAVPQQAPQLENYLGARVGENQALNNIAPPIKADPNLDQVTKAHGISAVADALTGIPRLMVAHAVRALSGHLAATNLSPETVQAVAQLLTSRNPQISAAVSEAINTANMTAANRARLIAAVQAVAGSRVPSATAIPQPPPQ